MLTVQNIQHDLSCMASAAKYVVAYSGGLDSHVLLHLMSQLKDGEVIAVHVNHQLNPRADDWVVHCQQVCDHLKIPLQVETITLDLKPGDSLEEQARNARYNAFQKYLDVDTVLLTAHTLNDQAETFLLHAIRGSGITGLSAMPVKKACNNSSHLRPLLSYTREDLEAYAMQNELQWIEDDSNIDTRFDRNFIRHEILPLLKQRFPAVLQGFSRSARLAAEANSVMQEDIAIAFKQLLPGSPGYMCDDGVSQRIKLVPLLSFSKTRQRLLLRYWLQQHGVRMPSEKQLKQIQQDVLCASDDANPKFVLGKQSLRRYREYLYLVDEKQPSIPAFGSHDDSQVIRTRRPGDRVKLPGKKHSQSMKNFFQMQGVPPWERDHVLLKFEDDLCVGFAKPELSCS